MLGFLEVSCIMMAASLYPDLQINIPNNNHTFDLCAKMETDTACAINQDSLDSLEVQVESKRKREVLMLVLIHEVVVNFSIDSG